jgi:hypothetical protein
MKLDFVAPVAARIERAQPGRVLVGEAAPRRHRRRAPMLPELGQFLFVSRTAIGRDCLHQRLVEPEQIDVLERRRLVQHLMGRGWGHGPFLTSEFGRIAEFGRINCGAR